MSAELAKDDTPGDLVASLFPAHKWGLTLAHNPHKDEGKLLADWCLGLMKPGQPAPFEWISPEERMNAIMSNSCWIMRWTPAKTQKQHAFAAFSLDELLTICSAINPELRPGIVS